MDLANTQNPKRETLYIYIHVYAAASSPPQKRILKKKQHHRNHKTREGRELEAKGRSSSIN